MTHLEEVKITLRIVHTYTHQIQVIITNANSYPQYNLGHKKEFRKKNQQKEPKNQNQNQNDDNNNVIYKGA